MGEVGPVGWFRGSHHLFGDPDVVVEAQPDGQIVAALRSLGIYDPTPGEIWSNSTDDITCWFIDIDYKDKTFFVRHLLHRCRPTLREV